MTRKNHIYRIASFVIVIALAVALTVTLGGCNVIFPVKGETLLPVSQEIINMYAGEYRHNWRYSRLSDRLKTCYGEIYASLYSRFDEDETVRLSDDNGGNVERIGIRVKLSAPLRNREEAQLLYTALVWDNPEFFYVSNQYSYEGTRSGNVLQYDIFCISYTLNASERATAIDLLDSTIRRIVDPICPGGVIPAGLSQAQVQLALHDALLRMCSYDDAASNADDPMQMYPLAFTAYGALVGERAVCEGYARAMQLLLHNVGISCTLVSGMETATGIPHMWNFVTVDNLNYHLDPTWNDADGFFNHTYFNVTTEEILRTHSIDDANVGIDTSTASAAQYYYMTGSFLTSGKPGDISTLIAGRIAEDADIIEMRFSPDVFGTALEFLTGKTALITRVNGKLAGTKKFMWAYELHINDAHCTVTIFKTS